jgi:lipoprotein signal peptidase
MRRLFRQWWTPTATVISVVALDQAVKAAVSNVRSSAIDPARNPGFATGWSPVPAIAVILVSVLVLAGFLAVVGRWAVQIGISPVIPALIAAGMFAHTLDRARFGAVRDFLSVGWLIIDVADLAVVAGLLALIVAFARRMLTLRTESRTIVLQLPAFRAVVVDREIARAA